MTKDKANARYEAAQKILQEYITANHLRHTEERFAILRYACQFKRQFTAIQLLERTKETMHLSKATVYNTILLFQQAHLLRKLNPQAGEQAAEYELVMSENGTMRFVCVRCGRETVFRDKALTQLLHQKHFSNFEMDNYSLHVYGHCKYCRKK